MKQVKFTKFPPLDYAGTEALNSLSMNLALCGTNIRKIMVTSCQASEGKSFLSMNVARTLAGLGYNVAYVDCDLRRSVVTSRFGVVGDGIKEQGIVHYLAGLCEADDVLYSTDTAGMYLVPIGRTVMNSLALLSNARLGMLLDHLLEMMDYVIVDAPPVGVIIDAAEIARYCDGTLFVIKYNAVRRRELADAKQQIERTGCPILGVALNSVSFDSYSSKNYYYKSYYSTYTSHYQTEDAAKVEHGGKHAKGEKR